MPANTDLILSAILLLEDRLGAGWTVRRYDEPVRGPGVPQPDAVLSLTAPDGNSVIQMVETKGQLFPRDVQRWLASLRPVAPDGRYLLLTPFLSPRSRELLESAGVNYIDTTGNVLVRAEQPSVFIRERGENKNPARGNEPLRSLRGPKAARVIRALCDYTEPVTSRKIAARAGVTPGYVSKVVGLLEREALLEREGRGPARVITRVLWADLIRRWSSDYRLLESNSARLFLAPLGIPAFLRDLQSWAAQTPSMLYAATGSFAATRRAPVARPSLLVCYVDAPVAVAEKTGLVRASQTGNVYLCEPLDPVAFDRSWVADGVRYAALSQVAVDCLTGPDRMPSEGEALLEWMAANEDDWRLSDRRPA